MARISRRRVMPAVYCDHRQPATGNTSTPAGVTIIRASTCPPNSAAYIAAVSGARGLNAQPHLLLQSLALLPT